MADADRRLDRGATSAARARPRREVSAVEVDPGPPRPHRRGRRAGARVPARRRATARSPRRAAVDAARAARRASSARWPACRSRSRT